MAALEAPNDHPQTASLGRADHGRRAAGAAVPIRNKGMASHGHSPVADGASGAAIGGPIGGEQAERETTLSRVANSERVCPGGAAPADDFDGGQPSSEKAVEIGCKPIVVAERARTSNNETEHGTHPQDSGWRGTSAERRAPPT